MTLFNEKKQQIAEVLSGLSFKEWTEIEQAIGRSYHQIKTELTSAEISSVIERL